MSTMQDHVGRSVARTRFATVLLNVFAGVALALAVVGIYGVEAFDPATYGAVAALLTAVALVAMYFPARRATSVDPMDVLREE